MLITRKCERPSAEAKKSERLSTRNNINNRAHRSCSISSPHNAFAILVSIYLVFFVLLNFNLARYQQDQYELEQDQEYLNGRNNIDSLTARIETEDQGGATGVLKEYNELKDLDTEAKIKLGGVTHLIEPPLCMQSNMYCSPDIIGEYLEQQAPSHAKQSFNDDYRPIIHQPSKVIPSHRRIPIHQANNLTHITYLRTIEPANGTATALQEFNPTILPLYKATAASKDGSLQSDLDPSLLNWIIGNYTNSSFTIEETNQVHYLSVERSTNHHGCGGGFRRIYSTAAEQCLFAFSLLDQHLHPIPRYGQIVVDMDYYILWKFLKRTKRPKDMCFINDVTIFVAKTTKGYDKKDQLFLLASSSNDGTILIPIDIRRIKYHYGYDNGNDSLKEWNKSTKLQGEPISHDLYHEGALYGHGLQIKILQQNKRYDSIPLGKFIKTHGGFVDWRKNYHFFEDESEEGTDTKTWLETSPMKPRTVTYMNLYFDKGIASFKHWVLFPNSSISTGRIRKRIFFDNNTQHFEFNDDDDAGSTKDGMFKQMSFKTVLLKKKSIQRGHIYRGTACCVDLVLDDIHQKSSMNMFTSTTKQQVKVKVGIGHTVTNERAYLSFFYAFNPKPPFQIIAQSGYFCPKAMKPTDRGHYDHMKTLDQFTKMGFIDNMRLFNQTLECPHVNFISGISDMVGDDQNVIISYGVNDCYSRSIIVNKEKIKLLLQP